MTGGPNATMMTRQTTGVQTHFARRLTLLGWLGGATTVQCESNQGGVGGVVNGSPSDRKRRVGFYIQFGRQLAVLETIGGVYTHLARQLSTGIGRAIGSSPTGRAVSLQC
jgi:hypothetical protein